jgi:nitroreductase
MSAFQPQTTNDLFEAIRTLRSVRRFRPDPVPDAALRAILEAATRAPSARNTQPWSFVAVRDPAVKRQLAELYQLAWRRAQPHVSAVDPDATIGGRQQHESMMRAVEHLAAHLDRVPVLILACLDTTQLGAMADASGKILAPQTVYASIFPAVQNLMLAARAFGLGTTLTTLHAGVEAQIRAVVDLPAHVHVAALVPLGYPVRPFRVTQRKAVDEVAFVDRWGKKF